jgi:hypothetical protein
MKVSTLAPKFLNVFVAFAVTMLLVKLGMKLNATLRKDLDLFYNNRLNVNTMIYFDTLYVATILLLTAIVCKIVRLPFLLMVVLVTLTVDLILPLLLYGNGNYINMLLSSWVEMGYKGYVYDCALVLITVGVMAVLKKVPMTCELHVLAIPALMVLNLYL